MITIISGTNRPNSRTALVSERYASILKDKGVEHKLLKLTDLPSSLLHPQMYKEDGVSKEVLDIQEQYIIGIDKFMVIIPEYNGGFPGVFKLFVDAMCASKYKANFHGKKISLTGVSAGRAGNLRGMESLTGIFNYLGATILPQKLPLSSIEGFVENDQLIADKIDSTIINQIENFLQF